MLEMKLHGILENQKFIVEKASPFEDTISITVDEITDEQLEQIVNKINEIFETELTVAGSTQIIYNSNIRGRDIFTPFILVSIIAAVIIIAIIVAIYGKTVGFTKVIALPIGISLVCEVLYFFALSITKVEINTFTTGIAVAIFVMAITYLMARFEKLKEAKKQN